MTSQTRNMAKNTSKTKKATKVLTFSLLASLLSSVQAQETQKADYFCGVDTPEAAQSIETIIPALYQIVSGDAGAKKDWPLMKSLFAPDAIVTPVFHKKGIPQASITSVDEFITLNKQIFKNINFYETEVKQTSLVYGHMATILSHYESRDDHNKEPYSQGINSFQLLNDGRRWCVISVTWDSDKGGHKIDSNTLKS